MFLVLKQANMLKSGLEGDITVNTTVADGVCDLLITGH